MRKLLHKLFVIFLLIYSLPTFAGVDVQGTVQKLQIAQNGSIVFSINSTVASTYCKAGWAGLNMYVPASNAQYPYYFSLLATAFSKGKSVYIANISKFDGTTSCDITQTGFGLMLLQ